MVAGLRSDDRLLGDGPHPAPQRGRDDPGDRQLPAAARQHRQARRRASARCAATPTCRATAPWASASSRPPPSSTRCATSSASSRRASTATTRSTRSARMRDGRREGVLRAGRQLRRRRRPTPTSTEAALRSAAPDRARLHQAQPLARRPGATALILPTLGRTERDRTGGRRAVRHRRGLDGRRCTPRGAARAGLARSCSPRSPSSAAGAATLGDRLRHPVGGLPRRLPPDPRPDRARRPRLRRLQREGRRPGGFALPHPPRDDRDVPHRHRQGQLHRQPARGTRRCPRAGCCCRPCARTTSTTPPSTASTTATPRCTHPVRGSKCGVAMLSPLFGMTGICPDQNGCPEWWS